QAGGRARQDHADAGDQGGAEQSEGDERQRPHGQASSPSPASSPPQVLILFPRGTPSDPHCPAASNGNRPGPSAIASPMAAGRCSYDELANSNLPSESLVSARDNLRIFAFGKAVTPSAHPPPAPT